MTPEELEQAREKLKEIASMLDTTKQKRELDTLRRRIGASKQRQYLSGGDATVGELIDNCHYALQTASMIEACKTASKNYEIALAATKEAARNYRIVAAIAFLSMLAAWAAVIVSLFINR